MANLPSQAFPMSMFGQLGSIQDARYGPDMHHLNLENFIRQNSVCGRNEYMYRSSQAYRRGRAGAPPLNFEDIQKE